MKLGDSKAIKTAQWFANEILRNDDINVIGKSAYQNITDQTVLLFVDELDAGEQDFVIGGGLRLLWDNLLTTNLQIGRAISTKGAYLNSDTWSYIADPGGVFSVIVPVNQAVAFSTGGTFARIDILEVRPIEFEYNSVSRNFKDPITGLVSSAIVKTRKEYGYEFAVREGDDTTVLTKEVTTFSVNTSTVGSDIAGKYVLFSTTYDDYYVWYNTGASSDPEVSERTGIAVSINAADDKDEIALATRSAITVAGVVVSGATNQIILTGSTFANLTDGTNGDMGSFFDAIAITQGNGALLHTAGWIKIAEIDVGASASAITQNDIRNVDESDQWENEPNGTLLLRVMQNVLTTQGDILVRGASMEERLAGGLLDTVLKGQGAGVKPIFEKFALRDTGVHIGNDSRNVGGNQVITGVGFESSIILFITRDSDTAKMNWSIGFDDGTTHYCFVMRNDGTLQEFQVVDSLYIKRDANNVLMGDVTVIGANGFTISWSLTGNITLDFMYWCIP